jgi:RNA polymerase sigma factor (sigma-70 family)
MTQLTDSPIEELVALAVRGDQAAWRELVRRYAGAVWRVAVAHRLSVADANDVSQATWTALALHLPALRRPQGVGRWLTTTARRECLRVIADRRRVHPAADLGELVAEQADRPDARVLAAVRDRALWQAFAELSEPCRALLGLLAHAPELSYAQLGRALGINLNSVGKTRGRCLTSLRRRLVQLDVLDGVAG